MYEKFDLFKWVGRIINKIMHVIRSQDASAVPNYVFPDEFAVCRISNPFLQFQILQHVVERVNGNTEVSKFIESSRSPDKDIVILNEEETDYMVGITEARPYSARSEQRGYPEQYEQCRFEVFKLYLASTITHRRIQIIFMNDMKFLPAPKILIVPTNCVRQGSDEGREITIALKRDVLNVNHYSHRRVPFRALQRDPDLQRLTLGESSISILSLNSDIPDTRPSVILQRNIQTEQAQPQPQPQSQPQTQSQPQSQPQSQAQAQAQQLNQYTIKAILNQVLMDEMVCPISMSRIEKATASVSICQHVFQKDHIIQWLQRHNTCPVCRTKLTVADIYTLILS